MTIRALHSCVNIGVCIGIIAYVSVATSIVLGYTMYLIARAIIWLFKRDDNELK